MSLVVDRKLNSPLPPTPTYTYQLRAFLAAVRDGIPPLTPPADAVANMEVVDAIYRSADLGVREPSTPRS